MDSQSTPRGERRNTRLARALLQASPEASTPLLNATLTLIGNDQTTIDVVQQCFLRAGARVRSTAWLEAAQALATSSDAVILFADHYPRHLALQAVVELMVNTIIVVTGEVGFFTAPRTVQSVAPKVFVLRSPVLGSMLLDAVRSGLGGSAGQSSAGG